MLLYILNKVKFPINTSQLFDFFLEREYTNYFTLQEALTELVEAKFIHTEITHNKTFYKITETGVETIGFFNGDISPLIREEINQYLNDSYSKMQSDTSIKTDYYKNKNNEYDVRLQVLENNATLVDLTLVVPTQKIAEGITENWKNKNQDIYAYLMQQLL